MKKLDVEINIDVCQPSELDRKEQTLVEAAKKATDNSYSPYSHFRVGAALLLADGTVVVGANQENAAFSITICAERSAIFAAQAQHPELPIEAIAIAARNEKGFTPHPISPCGSCRQAMVEIETRYGKPLRILLYGEDCVYAMNSVGNLMPLSFMDLY